MHNIQHGNTGFYYHNDIRTLLNISITDYIRILAATFYAIQALRWRLKRNHRSYKL